MKHKPPIALRRGITREVLLLGPVALKFPSARSWRLFLQGLLANMQEKRFSHVSKNLCPVTTILPGGFCNAMPRVLPLSEADFSRLWDNDGAPMARLIVDNQTELPIEFSKPDSFGWLNGRIVAVDYGS